MKKSVYIFLVLLTASFVVPAYASISSNAQGSDVHVTVNSTVNAQSTTTSTSTSNCNIHMETNGQVQDYNSSNCDSIHLQSDDGHSTVNINNSGNNVSTSPFPTITTPDISITPHVTIDEQKIKDGIKNKSDKEKAAIEEKKKHIQQQHNVLLEKIKTFLQRLFSFHL